MSVKSFNKRSPFLSTATNALMALSLIALPVSLVAMPAHAAPLCSHVFQGIDEKLDLLLANARARGPVALQIPQAALDVVLKSDVPVFRQRLVKFLEIQEQNPERPALASLQAFYESMHYPVALSGPRLEMAHHITEQNILSILGDLSIQETLRLVVGDDPKHVAPDSLLGKYAAEAGLHLQERTFTERPAQARYGAVVQQPAPELKVGPARWLVPVDKNTFPIFQKYFNNIHGYSVYGHGNGVFNGTMHMNGGAAGPLGFLRETSPLPWVLLKTTEGSRMARYLSAFSNHTNGNPVGVVSGWTAPVRAPWNIPGEKAGEAYVTGKSSYMCCTRWQGDVPIGDKLVDEVIFAGPNDTPVVAKVNPPAIADNIAYLKSIWTYPMHEPISSVLGMAENNGKGEFASPGWVIQSYLVSAPVERVPMVFYFVQDVNAEIPAEPPLNFEQPW